MTEPTQEQVDQERERAVSLLRLTFLWSTCDLKSGHGVIAIDAIATALARRALEARDEACDRFRDAVESQQRSAVVANSQIICLNLLDAIAALRGGKR